MIMVIQIIILIALVLSFAGIIYTMLKVRKYSAPLTEDKELYSYYSTLYLISGMLLVCSITMLMLIHNNSL